MGGAEREEIFEQGQCIINTSPHKQTNKKKIIEKKIFLWKETAIFVSHTVYTQTSVTLFLL